jgi:four helix bundle protein
MKQEIQIRRLEDLQVWKKAVILASLIYHATNSGTFSKDFPLRDQIRRAVISISSNIAEGFGRYSLAEFANFLSIASGSTTEVKSQTYLARTLNYITRDQADKIIELCDEITRMIGGLRKKIVKNKQ